MTIKFYKTNAPHGYMNNFKRAKMFIYGRWWNNVEAPYQSRKTIVVAEQDAIWESTSPRQARDLGQKVTMIPDWDQKKAEVMYECCLAKFLQHHDLRKELIATEPEDLVEDSPIDYYWGCGADGSGLNMLGKTLMRIRSELKNEFRAGEKRSIF